MIEKIINILSGNLGTNKIIQILVIAIIFDTVLGSIRALKQRKGNSTIGINGMLRKVAMLLGMVFLVLIDYVFKIDLLFMIPDEISTTIHLNDIGLTEVFGIMYILWESISVLKNMYLCGLPIPKFMKEKLESLLKNMTTELDDKKESGKNE